MQRAVEIGDEVVIIGKASKYRGMTGTVVRACHGAHHGRLVVTVGDDTISILPENVRPITEEKR